MSNFAVVTTVNPPTKAIEKLHQLFGDKLIVVGDKKTPVDWEYKNVNYIPFAEKKEWSEDYAPENHYARKNIGYLEAMRRKADSITELDDDTIPNENWRRINEDVYSDSVYAELSETKGWFNVYDLFTDEYIWPRGFSLRHLKKTAICSDKKIVTSSIQQGMVDLEPDVDAIWRIVFNDKISFTKKRSVFLRSGAWCPFNSQNTFWFPKAYPLMYLPLHASFRMTDIFRSFIAQRCLWEVNDGVSFHSPSNTYQDRNGHDLLKDFKDEVSGYLNNDLFIETLDALSLKTGEENICDNMRTCYQAIVDKNILPEMEMRSLNQWIKEYEKIIATNME